MNEDNEGEHVRYINTKKNYFYIHCKKNKF